MLSYFIVIKKKICKSPLVLGAGGCETHEWRKTKNIQTKENKDWTKISVEARKKERCKILKRNETLKIEYESEKNPKIFRSLYLSSVGNLEVPPLSWIVRKRENVKQMKENWKL